MSGLVPNVVEPSMKMIEPVGVTVLPDGPVTVAVKVTDSPCAEGFTEELRAVAVDSRAAAFTICVSIPEVDPLKFESPLYTAVMDCEPVESEDVLYVATPDALRVPLPSVVPPSMNVTDPVGAAELPDAPATVAVNVTGCPVVEGLAEEVTTIVVEALAAAFTTCVTRFDVEPLKFESPLYRAVIE